MISEGQCEGLGWVLQSSRWWGAGAMKLGMTKVMGLLGVFVNGCDQVDVVVDRMDEGQRLWILWFTWGQEASIVWGNGLDRGAKYHRRVGMFGWVWLRSVEAVLLSWF